MGYTRRPKVSKFVGQDLTLTGPAPYLSGTNVDAFKDGAASLLSRLNDTTHIPENIHT